MRFNIVYNSGDLEMTNIYDGEATAVYPRNNRISWVGYCITGVVQVCMDSKCAIDEIDKDGSIWLTRKGN